MLTVKLMCYLFYVGSNSFERGLNINLWLLFLPRRTNKFVPTYLIDALSMMLPIFLFVYEVKLTG